MHLMHVTGEAEAAQAIRPWLYQYFMPIIWEWHFVGVFPHEHAQCVTCIITHYVAAFYCGLDGHLGEDIYCRLGPSY